MNHHRFIGRAPRRALLALITVGLVGLWSPAALASSSPQAKKLSMTNVTVAAGPNTANGPLFIALPAGSNVFKRYGLNVTWLNTTSGAVSSITTLLAGSAQFTSDGASAQVQSVQNGAPIRALAEIGVGGPQQIDISAQAAANHHISTNGSTGAKALAQFMALKGSHLNLAVSSLSSNAYYWFNAAAQAHGITTDFTQGGSADVNIVQVGSVPNQVTAFLSGKVDGLINVPPYTLQPGSVQIQFGRVAPLPSVVTNYLATTIQMIQQHPDTVQAFVNAIYAASRYPVQQTHAKAAAGDLYRMLANYNATPDPAQQAVLYKVSEPYWGGVNPFPSQRDFKTSVGVYNRTLKTPFTVPYSVFVVSHFAATAAKLFNLPA